MVVVAEAEAEVLQVSAFLDTIGSSRCTRMFLISLISSYPGPGFASKSQSRVCRKSVGDGFGASSF
jgi:hypothetical protein